MENLIVLILVISLWCIATLYALFGHKVIRKEEKQSELDYNDPQVRLWLDIIFSKTQKEAYTGKSFTK